jgi:protein gp37
MSARLEAMGQEKYSGLTSINQRGDRHFNGTVKLHEDELARPLSWRKGRRVFVCSMADLFHRDVPFGFIDRVFAVMALCPQHTFQILTKRADRMREYFESEDLLGRIDQAAGMAIEPDPNFRPSMADDSGAWDDFGVPWPLPNVHLGVTAEDQQAADERIRDLAETPAAVRWVSYEPAIERVRFPLIRIRLLREVMGDFPCSSLRHPAGETLGYVNQHGAVSVRTSDGKFLGVRPHEFDLLGPVVDWLVCGGESGGRPFGIEWADFARGQAKGAKIAFFMKQLGTWPIATESAWRRWTPTPVLDAGKTRRLEEFGDLYAGHVALALEGKGEDHAKWPQVLRVLCVREFPEVAAHV